MAHGTFLCQKSEGFETHNNFNTENIADLKANMINCLLITESIKYQWKKSLRKTNQTLFSAKFLKFVVRVLVCLSVKVFMELMWMLILQNGGCRRPTIRKKKMDTLL